MTKKCANCVSRGFLKKLLMEVRNKYIRHDYAIKDRFEAGIELTGPEVKSCKLGRVSFKGAYCGFETTHNKQKVVHEELYIKSLDIAPYLPAKREQRSYRTTRGRKLLLRKKEIDFLRGRSKEPGITIVPLRLYTKKRLIKLEIALAQGLKKYDKREKIKERDFLRRKQRIQGRV